MQLTNTRRDVCARDGFLVFPERGSPAEPALAG